MSFFSTKDRRKTIPKAMQPSLWPYMAAICQKNKIFVHAIGGMEDHVHIMMRLPPTLAEAQAILLIKAYSSKWMGRELRVAEGVWIVQRERFECSRSSVLYPKPGKASSEDDV